MKAELQAALDNPDRPEAQAILNRISRYASVIKGARPIGTATVSLPPTADSHWQSLYQSTTGGRLLMSLQGWPFLVAYSGRIRPRHVALLLANVAFQGYRFEGKVQHGRLLVPV